MFADTNIDDIVISAGLFGRAIDRAGVRRVVLGPVLVSPHS
jgi:hypothetical protein